MNTAVGQVWNGQNYAHDAGFVSALGMPLLDLLQPRRGERILDLGCGDGALTASISAAGAEVLAVDASESMLAAAAVRGLATRHLDGQHLLEAADLHGVFDAVFSNAALHWMRDADAVLRGVAAVLKPDGRFVGEFGGFGNVAAISSALRAALRYRYPERPIPDPWFFPTADGYRHRLMVHDFLVEECQLIPRPTPLPHGMVGWLRTFAGAYLFDLAKEDQEAILQDVAELLAPSLRTEEGTWMADYIRLRFQARRPLH